MIRRVLDWIADAINENRRLRKRVNELLVANNQEVQKRRDAEYNAASWHTAYYQNIHLEELVTRAVIMATAYPSLAQDLRDLLNKVHSR